MSKQVHIDNLDSTQLYNDVCQIIDATRNRVAVYVNSEICHTNWLIGKRIKEDVLYNQRAEYGKQIIKNLSIRLTEKYGKGWGFSTLQHCVRTAYTFTVDKIYRALSWLSAAASAFVCTVGSSALGVFAELPSRHLFCFCQWSGKYPPPLHFTPYTRTRFSAKR